MKNQLAVSKWTSEELKLLKNTYAKDLNDTQLSLFLRQAQALDLNPFNKEIYACIVQGRLVLMTSIDGLRKIAHRTGNYLGCKVEVVPGKDSKPYMAKCTVKKLVKNHVAEFEAEVMFDEYDTGKGNWVDIPHTMISKVAEAHALKRAFSQIENLFTEPEEVSTHNDNSFDSFPEEDVPVIQSVGTSESIVELPPEPKRTPIRVDPLTGKPPTGAQKLALAAGMDIMLSQIDTEDWKTYKPTFGKHVGKTIDQIGVSTALAYGKWLLDACQVKERAPSDEVLKFVATAMRFEKETST